LELEDFRAGRDYQRAQLRAAAGSTCTASAPRSPSIHVSPAQVGTRQPDPSGTGIGRVAVRSRLRGNDVLEDGRAENSERCARHATPPSPPLCLAGPDPAPRRSKGIPGGQSRSGAPVMWIPARGPGRHLGFGEWSNRFVQALQERNATTALHTTHVIAAPVAATHRAASSGTGIGRVGVGSRMRGNDVLEVGRAGNGKRCARHVTPTCRPMCLAGL